MAGLKSDVGHARNLHRIFFVEAYLPSHLSVCTSLFGLSICISLLPLGEGPGMRV